MLNIVIPMAGAGSRFAQAGYQLPKPLIPVHGVPMIKLVISNLRPAPPHRFLFIVQREHVKKHDVANNLRKWAPGSEVIVINGLTEGAACTALTAKSFIDSNEPLMIANSDQYVEIDMDAYLADAEKCDGLVMTMKAHDPKWSFADITPAGNISRIMEKEVISDEATVGIYNFATGADFVRAAEDMISNNERVNNEFYVAPVYNRLIKEGKEIRPFNIGSLGHGMHGLGTPADLDAFLALPLSRKAAEVA